MGVIFNLCLLILQVSVVLCALPPINKCSLSDSECLKKSAQDALSVFVAGIPELGTEQLDPCHLDIIDIDLSGLKLTFRNADIKGLKNAVIDILSFDSKKNVMKLNFHADVTLKSKYKASGRLLVLPISGDGDTTLKIKQLEVSLTMPYSIVKNENGKDVIELKSYKYTFKNEVNTHFKLTNLFNGNKELSEAMHKFMNENWKTISQEFAKPVIDQPMEKVYGAIKTFLKAMPLEEIANV